MANKNLAGCEVAVIRLVVRALSNALQREILDEPLAETLVTCVEALEGLYDEK